MSPRDFFKVALKLFALIVIFYGIVPSLANIFFITGYELSIEIAILMVIVILLFILFTMYILKFPDRIINFFKLDKGFESDSFNFKSVESEYIIEISCGLLGLYFILTSVPNLVYEGFMYFKANVSNSINKIFDMEYYEKKSLYIDILYLVIGFLTINYRKWLSKMLNRN